MQNDNQSPSVDPAPSQALGVVAPPPASPINTTSTPPSTQTQNSTAAPIEIANQNDGLPETKSNTLAEQAVPTFAKKAQSNIPIGAIFVAIVVFFALSVAAIVVFKKGS